MSDLVFSFTPDPADLERAGRLLRDVPSGLSKAISGAINRTLEHGRTLIKKRVMDELNVTQKAVLRAIKIKKASPGSLAGQITISRIPVKLGEFHPQQTRQGVKVLVRRTRGVETKRGAFIAVMKSGHKGVFRRDGPPTMTKGKRKPQVQVRPAVPIKELPGPTIAGVVGGKPGMAEGINSGLHATFAKNLDSQIARFTK